MLLLLTAVAPSAAAGAEGGDSKAPVTPAGWRVDPAGKEIAVSKLATGFQGPLGSPRTGPDSCPQAVAPRASSRPTCSTSTPAGGSTPCPTTPSRCRARRRSKVVPFGNPAAPLNPRNQALSVGIMSYDGGIGYGVLADRDTLPDVGEAAAGLERALEALVAAAG